MNTRVLICLSMVVSFSCNMHETEEERLRQRLQDIKQELEASRQTTEVLLELGKLMDSIDRNRFDVMVDWREKPTPHNKYKYRLAAINNYVVDTQLRIQHLQQQIEKVKQVKSVSPEVERIIVGLTERITLRNTELGKLHAQLLQYTTENKELLQHDNLQDVALGENEARLSQQEEELVVLQARVNAAQSTYRSVQADAYFGEARALEEVSNRTKFAAAKKKETLVKALALYRQAMQLGHAEARGKVQELQVLVQ